MTDLYELLNVSPRASKQVIEAAFKVLCQAYHPDHNQGYNDLFASMVSARETLVDTSKRAQYDRSIRDAMANKKVVGSYEIVKFLAEGAMGRTYVVRHLITKKLAVLKACLEVGPEHSEIMLNEARAIWDIRHYAFPSVREVIRLDDGAMAIVMSYVPGPTLEQAVKHIGAIEPEHACWIFERLLAGLNYLHANGVIHGDIKPQNIILQPHNHGAVMIDLGLSMVKPSKVDKNIGYTAHFSPPEQLSKERKPLIPESDLYALGMTMIYALTGRMAKRTDPAIGKLPQELGKFLLELTHPDILKRPNWDVNLLQRFGEIRSQSFGTRNTKGKVFPTVPCDIIT